MIREQSVETQRMTPANAWHLEIGRKDCSDLQKGLDHEWLVTNGLGGYASGSLIGATTRSYHGLLVAALQPPVERVVLVTKMDEEVTLPDGQTLKLGVNEYQDAIDPQGYQYLDSVLLEGSIPCFTYRLNDHLLLEKRVWMEYGQNTTYVQYTLRGSLDSENATSPLTLHLLPFCLTRDYHSVTQGRADWRFQVESQQHRIRVRAFDGAPSYELVASPLATFVPTAVWYWHVQHRRDLERGLPAFEDVYQPGMFRLSLLPGMRTTLVISAEDHLAEPFGSAQHEEAVAQALVRHGRRTRQLLSAANRSRDDLQMRDPVLARLVVAADQFIVARTDYDHQAARGPRPALSPSRKTIIAGYPWFTDWGRDSMISLPGLLLSTGRYSEARGLLKAFLAFEHHGLIPNRFPDQGKVPEYNTVDAALWLFQAIDHYLVATMDWTLVKELFPVLDDIIDWYVRGTDFGIGMDAASGLLHAGVAQVQLTWMDAKVGDWVVTPRRGKPVEINALWYCALALMESWAVHISTDATRYSELRTRVRQHFASSFWYQEGGYLYDVIDVEGVEGQHDASLRPNQLFAASLTRDLLSEAQTASMLSKVTEHLLTPLGLRSLSPADPEYHHHFNGSVRERDAAYHQGTVWPWLIGPYSDVHLRVHNDPQAIRALLQPLIEHLWDACLGTISEVAEPDPPFAPAACFAQAWSVAEVLRCWLLAVE